MIDINDAISALLKMSLIVKNCIILVISDTIKIDVMLIKISTHLRIEINVTNASLKGSQIKHIKEIKKYPMISYDFVNKTFFFYFYKSKNIYIIISFYII